MPHGDTSTTDSYTGAITGTIVLKDGGPQRGGRVLIFDAKSGPPPMPEKYGRAPDIMSDVSDDGTITVELPPGTYYVMTIKRLSGDRIGPPLEGDYVWRNVDDQGLPREYIVKSGRTTALGTIVAVPLAGTLRSDMIMNRAIITAIEGKVIDRNGRPVVDAVVVAFLRLDVKESKRPQFISDRTDNNGSYVLRLTEGSYYLMARDGLASGPPVIGQLLGYYGGEEPMPVTVRNGEIVKGADLTVRPFTGKGTFPETTAPQ